MKIALYIFISAISVLTTFSCGKDKDESNNIEISGTIQKQGITTYQYGMHVIDGYALRSSAVNLDDYLNQYVTVEGYKIDGYPVDGGPDFIEVLRVKK